MEYYKIMQFNIIENIDIIEGIEKLNSDSCDLIIADPPFNQKKEHIYKEIKDDIAPEEYYDWCEEWIKNGFRILKETGSFWIYINSKHLGRLQTIMAKYGIWQNTIVWHYSNPTPDIKRFPKTWSAFLFFSKTENFTFHPQAEEDRSFGRNEGKTRMSDIWEDTPKLTGGFLAQNEVILYPNEFKRIFPYQLPMKLISRIIKFCSSPNDVIIDLFAHSGTTSVCSLLLKRNSMAIEKSAFFVKEAQKRIERSQFGFFKDFKKNNENNN